MKELTLNTAMPMTETKTGQQIRQAVIVLGMHRSGTSALTGMLEILGCQTPANQIPKLEQNAKGFFESRPVARLNDRLMDKADHVWDSLGPMPADWMIAPGITELLQEGQALLEEEFGTPPLLALKDPRLCRLLPYWLQVLQDSNVHPVVLHTHRHPLEVARSLEVRNGFSHAQGLVMWLTYVLQAEADSRACPRTFTSFDRLLADPAGELAAIQKHLDLPLPVPVVQKAEALHAFLSPEMRHHTQTAPTPLPRAVSMVYDILQGWAETGENPDDHAALDQLRAAVFDLFGQTSGDAAQAELLCTVLDHLEEAHSADPPQDASQAEQARLRAELKQTTLRLADMTHLKNVAEAAFREVDDRLVASLQASKNLTQLLTALTDEKAREIRNRETLTEQLAQAEEKYRVMAEEMSRLAGENSALHHRVAQAEEDLRVMRNSTIWRKTAALRRLKDKMGGKKG